jgi:hypothetical protein
MMITSKKLMKFCSLFSSKRHSSIENPFTITIYVQKSTRLLISRRSYLTDLYKPVAFKSYIDEIKPLLVPPVSNRLLHSNDLQVMVVGGPNQREVRAKNINSV